MATVTIALPSQSAQTDFNTRRWNAILSDRSLARIEGRIETDRHGRIIMSPPPAPSHGRYQSRIAGLLQELMADGETVTECPISTADGVKGADVAWASPEIMRNLGNRSCFPEAPEICVEVLSPDNTPAEVKEKTALYFDAGAAEVWICSTAGKMRFLGKRGQLAGGSRLCPKFPKEIALRRNFGS